MHWFFLVVRVSSGSRYKSPTGLHPPIYEQVPDCYYNLILRGKDSGRASPDELKQVHILSRPGYFCSLCLLSRVPVPDFSPYPRLLFVSNGPCVSQMHRGPPVLSILTSQFGLDTLFAGNHYHSPLETLPLTHTRLSFIHGLHILANSTF